MSTQLIGIATILIVAPLSAILGLVTHELFHWIGGYLCDGSPRFIDKIYGIPGAVDFDSAHSMSDFHIRVTGGGVMIFPITFCIFLLFSSFEAITSQTTEMAKFFFLFGASFMSEVDILALRYPSAWRELTQGDPIDRTDFGYQLPETE